MQGFRFAMLLLLKKHTTPCFIAEKINHREQLTFLAA
jgi:hypothetical protein